MLAMIIVMLIMMMKRRRIRIIYFNDDDEVAQHCKSPIHQMTAEREELRRGSHKPMETSSTRSNLSRGVHLKVGGEPI